MSQLEKIWQTWIKYTFVYTLLIGSLAAIFVSVRAAETVNESQLVLRKLLLGYLEKETPRIADEIYLHLDSLEQRQRNLNELIVGYGSAKLTFTPTQDLRDTGETPHKTWSDDRLHSSLRYPLYFGELRLGYLDLQVTWLPFWDMAPFQKSMLIAAFILLIIVASCGATYTLSKRKIFYPALEEFKAQSSKEALMRIASQVAHDIRSPLAALRVLSLNISQLPEDRRILVRNAIDRINDIANDLLTKARADSPSEQNGLGPVLSNPLPERREWLMGMIEEVISEKRLVFRTADRAQFELEMDNGSRFAFTSMASMNFKRAFSNLLSNSIEAIDGRGEIRIRCTLANENFVKLEIIDTGKGIPPAILKKLGRDTLSFDKPNGTGLGYMYAKKVTEDSGGSISIHSQVGVGTTVRLSIPVCGRPKGFVSEIDCRKINLIVAVDDDESVHQIWKSRFSNLSIPLVHLYNPYELQAWIKDNCALSLTQTLILCDYEFRNHEKNGAQLIEDLGISHCSVLVTSRYEEPAVVGKCGELSLRYLPKSLAATIPISSMKTLQADAVLIDDDPLIRQLWTNSAEQHGVRLLTFSRIGDFTDLQNSLDRHIPIYVDCSIESPTDGLLYAESLQKAGHYQVFIATGYNPSDLKIKPESITILGKSPPWMSDAEIIQE